MDQAARDAMDADFSAYRPIRTQVRRLITLGQKAGRPWDAAATVGEVAKATKVTPEEVVRLITECGYLMEVIENPDAPIGEWIIFEDGE